MARRDSKATAQVAVNIRKLLQDLLREHVRSASDRRELAEHIGCSVGHVQSMIYEGKGGLDTWAKAFAYFYEIDAEALRNFKTYLKICVPLEGSDKIWARLKSELGASEDDCFFFARCAFEACRIKKEIEEARKPKGRSP